MQSSACYAYRDGYCEEPWHTHSIEVVRCIAGRWEFEGLARKISLITGADEAIVRDLILVAGLLHDIAKVDELYQGDCAKDTCRYFPRHWRRSAIASLEPAYRAGILSMEGFHERFKALLINDGHPGSVGDLYILLVFIPVFLHSYAHIREESLFDEPYRHESTRLRYRDIVIHDDCLEHIIGAINDAERYIASSVGRRLISELKGIVEEQAIKLTTVVNEEDLRDAMMKRSYSISKLVAEAALGLLNMCDGQVAYRNRALGC